MGRCVLFKPCRSISQEGRVYSEAVFNETINIVEVDEGLDGETFFLYLFLAAGVVLLLVLGQQGLASMGKRRGGGSRYLKPFYFSLWSPFNRTFPM